MWHMGLVFLAAKYDVNAVIPLLVIVFEVLNLIVQAYPKEVVRFVVGFGDFIEEDNNIFGAGASMEESSCALVVGSYPSLKGYMYPLLLMLIP
jgi:hypothetical protein